MRILTQVITRTFDFRNIQDLVDSISVYDDNV